jgi:hypothetical protein
MPPPHPCPNIAMVNWAWLDDFAGFCCMPPALAGYL